MGADKVSAVLHFIRISFPVLMFYGGNKREVPTQAVERSMWDFPLLIVEVKKEGIRGQR